MRGWTVWTERDKFSNYYRGNVRAQGKLRRFASGVFRANGKLGNVLRRVITRLNPATFSIYDNAAEPFIISIY